MTKTPAIPLLALGAAALLALSCGGDGGGTRLPTAPPPAAPAPAPPPPELEPDPFDPKLWRELVFGAHLCPSDTTDAGCIEAWFGMPVEERTTRLLAAIPSFNILTLQDPPAWAPAEPLTGGGLWLRVWGRVEWCGSAGLWARGCRLKPAFPLASAVGEVMWFRGPVGRGCRLKPAVQGVWVVGVG